MTGNTGAGGPGRPDLNRRPLRPVSRDLVLSQPLLADHPKENTMPTIGSRARAELRRDEQRRRIDAKKRQLRGGQRDRQALKGHLHRRIFGV